jgi:ribosomal protein L10
MSFSFFLSRSRCRALLSSYVRAASLPAHAMRSYATQSPRKSYFLSLYSRIFQDSPLVLVLQYAGFSVNQLTEFRARLKQEQIHFTVTKNRLVQHCIKNTRYQSMFPLFSSSVGMVYLDAPMAASPPDAVIVRLRSLMTIVEAYPRQLLLIGGKWDDSLVTPTELRYALSLPTLGELHSEMTQLLQQPACSLVQLLEHPAMQLASSLDMHVKQSST